MTPKWDIDDMAQRLTSLVPPGLAEAQKDLNAHFRDILIQGFRHLDLVTREEFDVQSELLKRTRIRLDALEKKVCTLETTIQLPKPS